MRPDRVVVLAPLLDHDRGLGQGVEDFTVQEFITQFPVEGLHVAILPRTSGLDVGGLRTDGRNPLAQCQGDELRPVVGTDVRWDASGDEQIAESGDDVGGVEPSGDLDRQALPTELVDDAQHDQT